MVPDNKKSPPLEGGSSTKNGGMWTLKHKISSTKLYEILIKTELKGENYMDIKRFYNQIKMCLNDMDRLQEDLLHTYQFMKIHYDFQ